MSPSNGRIKRDGSRRDDGYPSGSHDTPETVIPMMLATAMLILADDAPTDASAGIELVRAMLIVLGILIMAGLLVFGTRSKIVRRQSNRPTAREQIEQAKAVGGAGGRRWEPEAAGSSKRSGHATTQAVNEARHLAALLDNKTERLEQLLAEAETCIARLEHVLHEHREKEGQLHPRPADSPDSSSTASTHRDQATEAISHTPADPLTRSVYELADQGHDSVEIAQRLDEQVGKVDLILALRDE